jgi:glutamyl-tRNA synthetase
LTVKTRFAPSPTGYLHIGGARTALFNYLFAKHNKGVYILRIEDTDLERSQEKYVEDILGGLAWLGINWDEGPYFQKDRMDLYKEYAYRLLEEGYAYKCYCTAEMLEEKRKTALKEGRKPAYDRTCRELKDVPEDKPYVVRFKTPLSGEVSFDDIIRGSITFKCEELDDLVIFRSDNTPTYNFTVVIDDALMGLTHIIRGDDHINNTPRQIIIYKALGFKTPMFAHVPLIHGKDKARLSKRHGAVSLLEYKNDGFLSEALLNYLSRLGWAHGDQEVFSREELIESFTLEHVGKSPAIFDIDKLLWLNGHYMKTLPEQTIAERLIPFLEETGIKMDQHAVNILIPVVKNLKERAKTMKEMASMARFFFTDDFEYDEKAREKFLTIDTMPVLDSFLSGIKSFTSIDDNEQKKLIEGMVKTFNKKVVEIIQPIRVALSGKTVSPGIFEVIAILGKEQVEQRIERAIKFIKEQ